MRFCAESAAILDRKMQVNVRKIRNFSIKPNTLSLLREKPANLR